MQCTSYYRDPYEAQAWELYLRECALRTAREEVAFLEATGGATGPEIARIRERVLGADGATVSLRSVLLEDDGALCLRVRQLLEQAGVHTFLRHQTTYVLKNDAGRVRELAQQAFF